MILNTLARASGPLPKARTLALRGVGGKFGPCAPAVKFDGPKGHVAGRGFMPGFMPRRLRDGDLVQLRAARHKSRAFQPHSFVSVTWQWLRSENVR